MIERLDEEPIHWYYIAGRRLPATGVCLLVLALTVLGLVMLFSIGRAAEGIRGGIFLKQSIWSGIAAGAFGCALWLDFKKFQKAWWLGFAGIAVLLLVFVPGLGVHVNGASRWISLGLMNMQVSDAARILFVFLLAGYLSSLRRRPAWWSGTLIPVAFIGLFGCLLLFQPDFGTAVLYGLVGCLMVFLAGSSVILLMSLILLGLAVFSVLVALDPVRLERILSFLNVEAHRSEGAYQLWQGLTGFGLGGVSGVGLGNGRQQFAFLPEAHTDFIFPIIGEELGLPATLAVVVLFLLMFSIVWRQLNRAPDRFEYLLTAGCLFFISLQAMINMGVATGLLPTKGMSLPFISYGGSNLVANYFLAGVIVRNLWRWNDPVNYSAKEIE